MTITQWLIPLSLVLSLVGLFIAWRAYARMRERRELDAIEAELDRIEEEIKKLP